MSPTKLKNETLLVSWLWVLCRFAYSSESSLERACAGIRCYNGGTYEFSMADNYCVCRCSAGFSGLLCDTELFESSWPSGPYALLMPLAGCPESSNRGWSPGYIHLTTSLPTEIWRHSVSNDGSDILEGVTSERGTHLEGPFGNFTIRLNFCYKHDVQFSKGASYWPMGNYNIFGVAEGCPDGFTEVNYTYHLPNVRSWSSDGHLPYISIRFHDQEMVTRQCKRTGGEKKYPANWDNFVFLKEEVGCNKNAGEFDVLEETIYFGGKNEKLIGANISNAISYCHYWKPIMDARSLCSSGQHHCGRGHCIERSALCDGTSHCLDNIDENEDGCSQKCEEMEFHCGDGVCISKELVCDYETDCIDGRDEEQENCAQRCHVREFYCRSSEYCISDMWLCDGWEDCWDGSDEEFVNCKFEEQCGQDEVKCTLGHCVLIPECPNVRDCGKVTHPNESECTLDPCKMLFHCGQGVCIGTEFVCDGNNDCSDGTDELDVNCHFKCTNNDFYCRATECIPINQICEDIYGCETESDKYDAPSLAMDCLNKLGLTDETIEDFQISASSWLATNPARMVRPLLESWCPDITDQRPYIQIDFYSHVVISGLVIYNWAKTVGTTVYNEYRETIVPVGCRSFSVLYAVFQDTFFTYRDKEFEIDVSRNFSEPQLFTFLLPFLARYVRIYPLTDIHGGKLCMRFELLGCKNTGQLSTICEGNLASFWILHPLLKPSSNPVSLSYSDNVTSMEECRLVCRQLFDDCSAIEYSPGQCHIYQHVASENYQTAVSDLSLLVCLTDSKDEYIKTQMSPEKFCVAQAGPSELVSTGYPFHYPSDTMHMWRIKTLDDMFLRVTFIDISLHKQMDSIKEDCDVITVNDVKEFARVDMRYNGKSLTVPIDRSSLFIFFKTCPRVVRETDTGRGFRLLHSTERIPTVLRGAVNFNPGRVVTYILLGWSLTHKGQWWAYNRSEFMTFSLNYFNVPCNNDFTFELDGIQYCNKRRPRNQLRALKIQINFEFSGNITARAPEGFSATLTSLPEEKYHEPLITTSENLATNFGTSMENGLEVCSTELKKCYTYFSPSTRSSWRMESNWCRDLGYTFINFHTRAETDFVSSWMMDANKGRNLFDAFYVGHKEFYAYIGLMRTKERTRLKEIWEDGSQVSFTKWGELEPAHVDFNFCTELVLTIASGSLTWKTCTCDETPPLDPGHYFGTICEKPYSNTSSTTPYLDGNNMGYRQLEPGVGLSNLFHCQDGDWVHILAVCDGINDCSDDSDELNCETITNRQCMEDEFTCTSGECVHVDKICNYIEDCTPDGNDEFCDFPACLNTEFQCHNHQCIPLYARCDAVADCLDGTDEIDCVTCNATTSFLCVDLTCIHKSMVCDKYTDCIDEADENNCSLTFITCLDRWLSGYHRNATIEREGQDTVQCGFYWMGENILKQTTTIEVDTTWSAGPSNELQLIVETSQFRAHGDNCIQEILISCLETAKQLGEYFDPFLNGSYSHCLQLTATVSFRFSNSCDVSSMYVPAAGEKKLILVHYNCRNYIWRTNTLGYGGMNISIGPVICMSEHVIMDEVIGCEDGAPAPASTRCLFDLNRAGTIEGCRNFRHLEQCEHFDCPSEYIKCPGSFCLAMRFVCDGERQCPGGEDEDRCAQCLNRNVSLSIVYHGTANEGTRSYIDKFARQFVSDTGGLYVVSYDMLSDADRTIRVYKRSVNPLSETINKETNVQTETQTNHLISTIDSWHEHDSRYSVIFIEDDKTSERVSADISLNGSQLETFYRVRLDTGMKMTTMEHSGTTSRETDIVMRTLDILGFIGASMFPDICQDSKRHCNGQYICSSSIVCIPMSQVCDGIKQCPSEDDEKMCDFQCHDKCSCTRYIVNCNGVNLTEADIDEISPTTRILDISNNELLNYGTFTLSKSFPQMVKLKASNCGIRYVGDHAFSSTPHLLHLDLSFNNIIAVKTESFAGLLFLKELNLEGNIYVEIIEQFSFQSLISLKELSISNTHVSRILPNTFAGLDVDVLDISNNKISKIHGFAFNKLAVKYLNIDGNEIKHFDSNIFAGVSNILRLQTPEFKFCCYKPSALPEDNCLPYKDEFSSCENLMRNSALQTLLWILGIAALIGNSFTMLYRIVYDKARLKTGFGMFVTNLAASDFLMGMYLVVIAIADLSFRNRYISMEDYWRSSGWCNLAGILAMVSSEASTLFLCLITIDRLLVITFPYGQFRFNTSKASMVTFFSWVLSWFIAVLPVAYTSYFQDSLYSTTGVCITLPLNRRLSPGWQFLIFIGLNLITFSLIAISQLMAYLGTWKHSNSMQRVAFKRRKDLTVARNLLLVVTTDFLCWLPICVMGIMALQGRVISGDVYAWTTVFILPVNSALNPFLYTLSAIIGRNSFNPRLDEHQRPTKKGISRRMLRFWTSNSIVNSRPVDYQTLENLLTGNTRLTPSEILMISLSTVRSLHCLHHFGLGHGNLCINDVYVGQINTDKVALNVQPKKMKQKNHTAKDINKFGCIVKRLLKCARTMKT